MAKEIKKMPGTHVSLDIADQAAVAQALLGKNKGYKYYVFGYGSLATSPAQEYLKQIASSPTSDYYRYRYTIAGSDVIFKEFFEKICPNTNYVFKSSTNGTVTRSEGTVKGVTYSPISIPVVTWWEKILLMISGLVQ